MLGFRQQVSKDASCGCPACFRSVRIFLFARGVLLEQCHGLWVLVFCCQQEGCFAFPIFALRGSAALNQERHKFGLSGRCGKVEWGQPGFAGRLDICLFVEK
jgi:hypothetical protein